MSETSTFAPRATTEQVEEGRTDRDDHQPDDQDGKQPNPGIELTTAHGLDGHGREIETDGCNDRASHNGRHQSFEPANARSYDDQSDDAVQHPRCNDAAERNIEV